MTILCRRWGKEWLNVDLSTVKKWTRFMEIHYARTEHEEITVIFVPELQDIVPSQQEFEELWESRQKAKRKPATVLYNIYRIAYIL